jgi:hypothetical protein
MWYAVPGHSWGRVPLDRAIFEAAYSLKVLPDRVRRTRYDALALCAHMNPKSLAPTLEEIEQMDERDRRWMIVYYDQLPGALTHREQQRAQRESRGDPLAGLK